MLLLVLNLRYILLIQTFIHSTCHISHMLIIIFVLRTPKNVPSSSVECRAEEWPPGRINVPTKLPILLDGLRVIHYQQLSTKERELRKNSPRPNTPTVPYRALPPILGWVRQPRGLFSTTSHPLLRVPFVSCLPNILTGSVDPEDFLCLPATLSALPARTYPPP